MLMMEGAFVNGSQTGGNMVTLICESEQVSVPSWVVDLRSFLRWADSDDLPEHGRIWCLKGEVFVDMSMEQIFSHVRVKAVFFAVLEGLITGEELGLFLPDGARLTNVDADLGAVPDAV